MRRSRRRRDDTISAFLSKILKPFSQIGFIIIKFNFN